jgi:hypothetical protein
MNNTDIRIKAEMVLVTLNASLWAARKSMKDTDITEKFKEGEHLPPKEVATVGSKSIFPRKYIQAVLKQKNRALIWMKSKGITADAKTAIIPMELRQEARDVLDSCKSDFFKAVDEILMNYDDSLIKYAEHYPEWREFILNSAMSLEQIQDKFSFSFRLMPFATWEGEEEELCKEFYIQLLEQTAEELSDYNFNVLSGADKITERGVNKINDLVAKIKSFSFLDPNLLPLALFLEKSIKEARQMQDAVDPNSPITGEAKKRVQKLLSIMSDPKVLVRICEELVKNGSYDVVGNFQGSSVNDFVSHVESSEEDDDVQEGLEFSDDIDTGVIDDLSLLGQDICIEQNNMEFDFNPVFI